jgi:hypothetical protein
MPSFLPHPYPSPRRVPTPFSKRELVPSSTPFLLLTQGYISFTPDVLLVMVEWAE